jgi:hypothetical protein
MAFFVSQITIAGHASLTHDDIPQYHLLSLNRGFAPLHSRRLPRPGVIHLNRSIVARIAVSISAIFFASCTTNTPSGPIGSTFDTATPLELVDSNDTPTPPSSSHLTSLRKAHITGTITGSKVDVLSLGALEPGDRVIVSVKAATGSTLDPTIALFNSAQEVIALNDDVDLDAGRVDSAFDEIITVAGDPYYLAISKYFFGNETGDYVGDVEIQRAVDVPVPPTQILVLDFNGGSIEIPGDQTYTFGAFNADDIDAEDGDDYTGKTFQIKATIIDTVKSNYAGTGLVIQTTDEPLPPADTFSTVFLGAFSSTKFGVAQEVDQDNRNCCDDGIVFTDDFVKPFSPRPSVNGIAIAIGNVAAHEAGHLLGLNHVADVTALMDTTGSASTLLSDQNFKTAPLSITIFPIGFQNDQTLFDRVIPAP